MAHDRFNAVNDTAVGHAGDASARKRRKLVIAAVCPPRMPLPQQAAPMPILRMDSVGLKARTGKVD